MIDIECQIETVTYYNEENDYAVLRAKICSNSDLITVVGNIASPTPGEILSMSGDWVSHPRFGDQFKVTFYSTSVPATIVGIEKYLGSGLIKGVGCVMARRIVKLFGEKTLDIIDSNPEKLLAVEGIGKHRIDMIKKAWVEQKEIRSVMIFLQSYGISSTYVVKIYKRYGNEAISVVKENPYRLAHDIFGIGFLTADKIAQKLGFDLKSPLRAAAGVMFVLHELTEDGHIYYPKEELLQKAQEMLNIEEEIIEASISTLLEENKIAIEPLCRNEATVLGVFLIKYYSAEKQISEMLKGINSSPKNIQEFHVNTALDFAQKQLSITLADRQIEAVKLSISNKLTIITGGPGTGKTTITKAILEIISQTTQKIVLAAPTGRAAKRMSEATGMTAKTIHRLLEFSPADGEFKKNENYQLNCDCVILDEASMIDTLLMYSLLKAIPKYAILIIVGDINQLPSVGAGSVLKDIIKSEIFPVIELNEIFRQAKKSQIVTNAHMIIHGNYPITESQEDSDFYFIPEDDQEKVLEKLLLVVKEKIPKKFGFNPIDDIQVLTPMNRGSVGTNGLNDALQESLNPNRFEIIKGGRKYRVGDKVMQLKNNYDKDVFNGDIGIVSIIDPEEQTMVVVVDGKDVIYEYAELDELVLAYAVSIHKSQGSEYPAVVIPLVMSHYMMLQRNLIYTGITRGKKLVVIIGSKKSMHIAVANNQTEKRNTWLSERIKYLYL